MPCVVLLKKDNLLEQIQKLKTEMQTLFSEHNVLLTDIYDVLENMPGKKQDKIFEKKKCGGKGKELDLINRNKTTKAIFYLNNFFFNFL